MRILGPRTSLTVFRWDLVYLAAQLAADERAGVAALAPPVQDAIVQLGQKRAAQEQAEDLAIVALAHVHKRDNDRDALLIAMGGVARATDKQAYAAMFGKLSPTATAKLGIDMESSEIARILGEIAAMPPAQPVRVAYEAPLTDAQQKLVLVKKDADEANVKLALARAEVGRFKLGLDQLRLSIHGQLLALLKDKAEADAFYRPASVTPGDDKAEATPEAGAPGATPTTPAAATPTPNGG